MAEREKSKLRRPKNVGEGVVKGVTSQSLRESEKVLLV